MKMREYELIIDEALKKGLTPERNLPKNEEWLWQAIGFRIGRGGLEGYRNSTDNPLSGVVDMLYSWPFPQWITGERYNFLIIRDSVVNYEDKVYVITDGYVATHIFDCDVLTFGLGTLMEVADFGEYAFMTNGVIMIYWDVGLADWHEIVASTTIPMMRTVCNFKGQMVGGGVLSAWHDCDETFYCWSKIGSADFTPDDNNEAGYRRDPYGGKVYHVRRLDDKVIGYSSKGITRLNPAIEPVPSFGFDELSNVGLINQGAMDGDLDRHVYVGTDLVVREVTREGIKELGYYLYMDDLNPTKDIIVKYDRIKKDFYIGNDEQTYLLSPYGLTQVPQHPSAVWTISEWDDELVMLPNTLDDPCVPMLSTGTVDMGYRGMKTVFSVEADVSFTIGPEAAVGWLNTLDAWGWGNYVPLNDEGIAVNIVSSTNFIILLRFEYVATSICLTYIKLQYKMTDTRGLRGAYVMPQRGYK